MAVYCRTLIVSGIGSDELFVDGPLDCLDSSVVTDLPTQDDVVTVGTLEDSGDSDADLWFGDISDLDFLIHARTATVCGYDGESDGNVRRV